MWSEVFGALLLLNTPDESLHLFVCVRVFFFFFAKPLLEFGAGADLVLLLYESEWMSVIEVMGD